MTDNKNYKTYITKNGTELSCPAENEKEMTAEQRVCYQNFINVLAQILVKYAAETDPKKV